MADDSSMEVAAKLIGLGESARAERVLLELLAREPRNADALHHLAAIAGQSNRIDQAIVWLRRAVVIAPGDATIWYHLGLAQYTLGRLAEAVDAYAKAIQINPAFAEAKTSVAMILLLRGEFERGWPMYESRWGSSFAGTKPVFRQPAWDGRPAPGRTLLLYPEQGFGDTIQFARFASIIAGSGPRVLLAVQPPLLRVLKTLVSFPGEVVSINQPLPPFDLHCPLMSVPGCMGVQPHTIPAAVPYLSADPADTTRWADRLGPGDDRLRVGLIWAGSAINTNDRNRSIAANQFGPLFDLPGLRWVSVQTGPGAGQGLALPQEIFDAGSLLTDFADTAGLLANLDLLISVDTAAVHLAGALNRPVWVLNQFMPDWRWQLGRSDSPWYPSARLFRQRFHGDWAGAVDSVRRALLERIESRSRGG